MKTFYGAIDKKSIYEMTKKVCDVLGHGKNHTAIPLIIGTMCAETQLGTLKDPTEFSVGSGIAQFDKIGYVDVLKRTSKTNKEIIREEFAIDIDKVTYSMLEYNPLLSIIFCRLKYRLIPEPIPKTLEAQAQYWKTYYNTSAGKGTVDHYIKLYKKHA